MKHTSQQWHAYQREGEIQRALSGSRMTRARRGIIDILGSSATPMTAEEVFQALHRTVPHAVLSTVYRNLDNMTAHGDVRRMILADGDRALFELADGPHRHYAVCLGCHLVFPLDGCPVEEFAEVTGRQLDFDVTDHSLVLYGYCRNCRPGHRDRTVR
jgi:Fe2+ or Zn2+ uptake regulation protein